MVELRSAGALFPVSGADRGPQQRTTTDVVRTVVRSGTVVSSLTPGTDVSNPPFTGSVDPATEVANDISHSGVRVIDTQWVVDVPTGSSRHNIDVGDGRITEVERGSQVAGRYGRARR